MSMIATTYVSFTSPIKLNLRITSGPIRPRVVPAMPMEPVAHTFSRLPLHVQVDSGTRTMRAYLAPIQRPLVLYGPEDFAAASSDTMEEHAERVLAILGEDAASTLQALIDGSELPDAPARVPREIPNWRAKAVLASMGLLAEVETFMAALPEPQRSVVELAWNNDGKVARKSDTIAMLAGSLELTNEQLDAMFIAADAIEI